MNTEFGTAGMPVTLKSAGKDIIANGIAHTFDRENFEIEIRGLRFVFEFRTDSNGQRIEQEVMSATGLKLLLYNFNNTLGTGLTSPLELGTLSNRKLYFAFLVGALSESSIRTVTYTFFLGETVNE